MIILRYFSSYRDVNYLNKKWQGIVGNMTSYFKIQQVLSLWSGR